MNRFRRACTTNGVVIPARQAGNRFLGSLKALQIRALAGRYDKSIPWNRFQGSWNVKKIRARFHGDVRSRCHRLSAASAGPATFTSSAKAGPAKLTAANGVCHRHGACGCERPPKLSIKVDQQPNDFSSGKNAQKRPKLCGPLQAHNSRRRPEVFPIGLAGRQARVRFSARHYREVFPTELTSDEEMERGLGECIVESLSMNYQMIK